MRIESVKGFDLRGEDAQDVALSDHDDFFEAWPKGRVLVVVEIVPDGCAAMVNAFQGEPPGEKIALRCVFLRCGHTWKTDRARWETGLDDNYCPACEDPNPVEITRTEWKQEADAEHEAHQDALRKRLREGL